MPTSVARFGNEAKTPRGGVFGEAKSSAQGNEGEGDAQTRIDYATGRARSDTPQSRELKAQSMIATRNDHATGKGNGIPPPQPSET